ncbi:ankyrin repeat domain-containing protein [Leptospira ilyithenensis]|uniref:Ankyrin repeat domain-containing protein n=1 Tax=Leptospira ilyithenensis TaxID=2484901 RepID=A0A4R9LIR4_9LEPT|nr:ankyrin repeat domain-containing protein [Leptospira ilyithenensis]TGN06535.1 ankyrin repeat domain-containing protein [Leptospira ilyithenensis]
MNSLFDFVKASDLEKIREVFKEDPNCLNSLDGFGVTPLSWSIRKKDHETLSILLELGADPLFPQRTGGSPFFEAVSLNDSRSISHLGSALAGAKEKGISVSWETQGESGNTILHYLIETDLKDIWDLILPSVPNDLWEMKNKEGWNAFLQSVVSGEEGFVSDVIRIAPGTCLHVDSEGKNAFHLAAERNLDSILPLLIGLDLEREAEDELGNTPLLSACEGDATEFIIEWVKLGVNLLAKNYEGDTAYSILHREKYGHSLKIAKEALGKVWKEALDANDASKIKEIQIFVAEEKPFTTEEKYKWKID